MPEDNKDKVVEPAKVETPKVETAKVEAPKVDDTVKRAFANTIADVVYQAADGSVWREKHFAEAQNKALGTEKPVLTHKRT